MPREPLNTSRSYFETASCTYKSLGVTGRQAKHVGVLVLTDQADATRGVVHSLQRAKHKWAAVVNGDTAFGEPCHTDMTSPHDTHSPQARTSCARRTLTAWLALTTAHQAMVTHMSNIVSPPHIESGFARSAAMYGLLPSSRVFAARSKKPSACDNSVDGPWLGNPPVPLDRHHDGNWVCQKEVGAYNSDKCKST